MDLCKANEETDDTIILNPVSPISTDTTAQDLELENFLEECNLRNFKIKDIPMLIEALHDMNDRTKHYFGIIGLCNIFTKYENIEFDAHIESILLAKLIKFLQNDAEPILQLQSALALGHLTSGNLNQSELLINYGAIPVLISKIKGGNNELLDSAVWTLVNLSAESKSHRNSIIKNGGMELFIEILVNPPSHEIYKICCKAIANLALDDICMNENIADHTAAVLIENLSVETDPEIISDLTSALSGILVHDERLIGVYVKLDIVKILVKLLQNSLNIILLPSSKILADLFNGSDEIAASILAHNPLPIAYKLLFCTDLIIRREACLVFSNMARRSPHITDHIISNPDIIQKLIKIGIYDALVVRRIAITALTNCTKHSTIFQKEVLLKNGVLDFFFGVIHPDFEVLLTRALTGILEFVKSGVEIMKISGYNYFLWYLIELDCKERLKSLLTHQNLKAKNLAEMILSLMPWDIMQFNKGNMLISNPG